MQRKHFTLNSPENSYMLRRAFFGNSTQLQLHGSIHLSSAYTDHSFSSLVLVLALFCVCLGSAFCVFSVLA